MDAFAAMLFLLQGPIRRTSKLQYHIP